MNFNLLKKKYYETSHFKTFNSIKLKNRINDDVRN